METVIQKISVLMMTMALCFIIILPAASAENPVTPQQEGWTIIEKEIPYGNGPGEVGADLSDLPGAAPSSFTVDDAGNIFILDRMNERIQVFSNGLNFVRSISLSGEARAGQDIAVDKAGNFYILNPNLLQIEQYDSNGAPVATIKLEQQRWHLIYGLPMYLRGNKLYIKTFNVDGIKRAFVPVGKIINEKLESLSSNEKDAIIDGYLLPSGKQFKGAEERVGGGKVVITDSDGTKRTITLSTPYRGKRVLGDDMHGNIYLMISGSKKVGNKKAMSVTKYDSKGNLTNQLALPLEATFERTRGYYVDKQGNVYSMQTGYDYMLLTVAKPK